MGMQAEAEEEVFLVVMIKLKVLLLLCSNPSAFIAVLDNTHHSLYCIKNKAIRLKV